MNLNKKISEASKLIELNSFSEAAKIIKAALRKKPTHTDALYLLSLIYAADGKQKDALDLLSKVIQLQPKHVSALYTKARILLDLHRYEESILLHNEAIKENDQNYWGYINRGNAYAGLNNFEKAIEDFDKAIEINPEIAAGFYNKANVLNERKEFREAIIHYDSALTRNKYAVDYWVNKGNTHLKLYQYDEALTCYKNALDIDPAHYRALCNLGNALGDLREDTGALDCFEKAITIEPNLPEAHWSKAITLLRLGRFKEGWIEYEWRWKLNRFTSPKRDFTKPNWIDVGLPKAGTLLVHAEQGFGDTIQFCRLLPLVCDAGLEVIFESQPELWSLLSNFDKRIKTIPRVTGSEHFDYHCPLLSLPLALNFDPTKTRLRSPYIKPDENKALSKANELSKNQKPKVGIVWQGSKTHENDINRSISLESFIKILNNRFDFYSLQRDRTDRETELLSRTGIKQPETFSDFSDTAAFISNLDLVISVDTSVAHLAAAIGKPTWILLPRVADFRWFWDREDTPWYPNVRLFRQKKLDHWDTTLETVHLELNRFDNFPNIS